MKIALVFCLTLTSAVPAECIESGNYNPDRVGSNPFPYLVGLHVVSHWCGGSLISHTFIITAAHCIDSVPCADITAYLGSIFYRRGLRRTPRSKIVHPEYVPETLLNDIGLLGIDSVSYSTNIKNIALPSVSKSNDSYEVEVAIASGWGMTSSISRHSQVVQAVELLVISNNGCSRVYNRIIPESQVCGASPSGAGICLGDSGGPFVLKKSGVLIGITSYTPTNSCVPHFGSAFTRVTSYRQWIANNTGI